MARLVTGGALASIVFVFAACGGGAADGDDGSTDDGGDLMATGEGPCDSAAECQGDVCVALIDGDHPPIYCTQECGGGCPDGFWCDDTTFALVGLDFCRFGDTPSEAPPEEPPRRPCTGDADCVGGEICATWQGERGCTLGCTVEADCTPPVPGGFTFDYLTCAPDETAGESRDACLPDPACFADPLSCTGGF